MNYDRYTNGKTTEIKTKKIKKKKTPAEILRKIPNAIPGKPMREIPQGF